jgi:hypothetical protein
VLWTVATHALRAFEHATRLAIHSAVKRCGKSRLLEIIEALAHNVLATTDASAAALFRIIEAAGDRPPTLAIDEADRLFGSARKDHDNADLIKLLNNGFRPGRPTFRCVGPHQTPTPFKNYAMAVIAGIGRLPDTIEDRAVNIAMRRRAGEIVAKFRLKTDVPSLLVLRERIAAWAEANLPVLGEPVDDMPSDLEDRAEDAWEPLLAVADAAGGDWPKLARAAAVALSREAAEDDGESVEIRLLGDVKAVFQSMPHVGFVPTELLLTELLKVDEAPWRDQDLTSCKLARRLRNFGVGPRQNSAGTKRGYHLEDLLDPFRRYTRPEPSEASEHRENVGSPSDMSLASDDSHVRQNSSRQRFGPGDTGLGQVLTGSDETASGRCRRCGRPQPDWVLDTRHGQCIDCAVAAFMARSRAPVSTAGTDRPRASNRSNGRTRGRPGPAVPDGPARP